MRSDWHRSALMAALGGMSVAAWVALWRLDESPYGHLLHPLAAGGAHAHGPAATGAIEAGALFAGGWLLMTVAMMLPSTLPLVDIFRRLTRDRADRTGLVALLVGGYLAVWLAFGVAAYASLLSLGALARQIAWLEAHGWIAAVGLLAGAGAFQFSSLKYRCLEKCRTPLMFVTERWRSGRERWRAFRLGVDHGIFCVGCCWALMLLMFIVGTAGLAWMLALGIVMAIEKNVSWGRRIGAPLGAALIGAGLLVAVSHLASTPPA